MNHGDQVLWKWSTLSPDWASVSSISQISDILCNQSWIVGARGVFQRSGIIVFAAFNKCLVSECLYYLMGKSVTWRRQHFASSFNFVSVIRNINFLISDQKGCSTGQCHQMCSREPLLLWQCQHISEVCGNQECNFTGVAYHCVSSLYAVS